MARRGSVILALVAGIVVGALVPSLLRTMQTDDDEQAKPKATAADTKPGTVRLTEEQILASAIDVVAVQGGTLAHRIIVPGTIIPHGDRIARVAVKLTATVAELRKRLGDPVAKGEVLAVLESREVADAKSEYLAARLTNELQQELFQRDKRLWESRVSTEQQFLRSRNAAAQTEMKFNIARQKLLALGLMESEITGLPNESETSLRLQEVRAPIAGRVVERKVDLGAALGRDNLETELFVIVDLERVWVELTVSPGDLPTVKEGQTVSVSARGLASTAMGQIIFISPVVDKDTRATRVVAEIANADGLWRPGSFVTASITVDQQAVALAVPLSGVQTMGDAKVVFVRTPDGFAKRAVVVGRADDRMAEIVSGLQPGETIAGRNSFVLKAELMKPASEE